MSPIVVLKKYGLVLLISVVCLVIGMVNILQSPYVSMIFGRVSAQSDVDITAEVRACLLTIEVLPEKRIPSTNNWQTILNVQIFDEDEDLAAEFDVESNSQGLANVDLCSLDTPLSEGEYSYWVKGYSHLRKNYGTFESFGTPETQLNLTELKAPDGLLLAGETSNEYNGYINTLDISTVITNLYTSDEKNDLNQDSKVNILDISNSITNFNLTGDCSPKEDADGIC